MTALYEFHRLSTIGVKIYNMIGAIFNSEATRLYIGVRFEPSLETTVSPS